MLLNALTNYLQNQPASADVQSAATQAVKTTDSTPSDNKDDPSLGLYTVSDRAVMVSAVAAEFDVRALKPEEFGAFQNRLQEFGLLDREGIQALSLIHTARLDNTDNQPLNAKNIVDNAYAQALEPGASYSQKKQVHLLHTLFSNLDSATPQQQKAS